MNIKLPVLASLLVLAGAAAASAAPAASLPYEAAAGAAKIAVAPTQFAILHALLDWRGGSNPDYAFYRSKDAEILAKTGITVKPLENETDRRILMSQLDAVRAARNNGVVTRKKKPISETQMAARHRSILTGYGSRISVGMANSDGAKPLPPTAAEKKSAFDAQAALMKELTPAMQALAASKDDSSFNGNLKAFNAVAARFEGRNYSLARAEGESYASVVERARNVYATESENLRRLAAAAGGAKFDALADLESLKATGSFFDGANGSKVPVPGKGAFVSKKDPNAVAASLAGKTALSADGKKAVPAPDRAERKPGLIGMLGSLLGGLFRTLGRVATALWHGALAVGKALLS